MVQKFDFWFSPAGENRRIHLYLPDDYDWTNERYPVVYMFDGHNLYFDSDATFGKSLGLKDFLDHWSKKMIVVGMECSNQDLCRQHPGICGQRPPSVADGTVLSHPAEATG